MAFQNFGWPTGRIPDIRLDALRKERIELLHRQADLALLDLDVTLNSMKILAMCREDKQRKIEIRTAPASVDPSQRLITVVCVPYEKAAPVEYRGEIWHEQFARGAFPDIAQQAGQIRVNRDHNKSRTVGKIVRFPDSNSGLLAEIRIAKTALGDETLSLAEEDCLSASIGFGVRPSDQSLDRRTMTRRIKRAQLDHVALVESPAYSDAKVMSVA